MTETALYISLWAYLFCVPLSESGQVFGWLSGLIYRLTHSQEAGRDSEEYTVLERKRVLPKWLYNPLIGCPKCHAGQVAFWWQVWEVSHGRGFDIPFILIAIAGAYALTTWHLIVEKWLNK